MILTVNRLKNYLAGFRGDAEVHIVPASDTKKWTYVHRADIELITDSCAPMIFVTIDGIEKTIDKSKPKE